MAEPHPDLAGWAIGETTPDESLALEAHLLRCDECRRAAADLRGLHALLERAAPPFEVPPDLESRVLAPPPPRPRRRRRWAWIAAPVSAAAAAAIVFVMSTGGPEPQRLALRSTLGENVDVTAEVRVTPVGREVELDINRLRDPRPDGLYELWFVAPDDTPRKPHRVSAGTFHPDSQGRGTVRLLAAADPKRYPRLSVTLQRSDGNPRRVGPEVLRPG
jgi:hypothetical protein